MKTSHGIFKGLYGDCGIYFQAGKYWQDNWPQEYGFKTQGELTAWIDARRASRPDLYPVEAA